MQVFFASIVRWHELGLWLNQDPIKKTVITMNLWWS